MRTTYLITWLLLSITLMSCIRDEAPNAEADILTCVVPADILKRDPVIENNKVTLMVKADIDLAPSVSGVYVDSRCDYFPCQRYGARLYFSAVLYGYL